MIDRIIGLDAVELSHRIRTRAGSRVVVECIPTVIQQATQIRMHILFLEIHLIHCRKEITRVVRLPAVLLV
jgi:hypothetical protein